MAGLSKPVVTTQLSPWGKAAAGAAAAMVANLLVYPLDLAKTRLQVQSKSDHVDQYKSTWDVISRVYKQNGLKGLYAGLGGTLLGVASTNFAYFYWYSLVRGAYVKKIASEQLTTATELALGAIAGALAQIFTIPVAVVTTRQQTTDDEEGLIGTAKQVVAEDGLAGLWRGLKASLILVVNPSITYGSSSRLRSLLFGDKPSLSVQENFLLGALSKSMATITTQPMIVAKVMQQSSEKVKEGQELKPTHHHHKVVINSFSEALVYLYKTEGIKGLFKGLGPQLVKGILVQGILLATKEKVELFMLLLIRAIAVKLQKARPVKLA